MADDGHQIAMSARLRPQNAEAVLGVVEGDPLDEAGENFLGHVTFSLSGLAIVFAVDTGCAASGLAIGDVRPWRPAWGRCLQAQWHKRRQGQGREPKTVISSMLQPLPTVLPTCAPTLSYRFQPSKSSILTGGFQHISIVMAAAMPRPIQIQQAPPAVPESPVRDRSYSAASSPGPWKKDSISSISTMPSLFSSTALKIRSWKS